MTDAPARALERLGYEAFRPGQRETLEAVLAGRDVLAILPTGAGKSLVFQLAAELLDGLVVVVSPLIALMRDQAAAAGRHGQDAAVLESTQAGARTRDELERALGGRADLLFVTPERLDRPAFTRRLRGARVALLVIDEAHCVSTWGHDFRPAYLSLAGAAASLGRPPLLALTATATPPVREDIVSLLVMRDPALVVRGVDRPNLFLECVRVEDEAAADRAVERVLFSDDEYGDGGIAEAMRGKGIVYTATTRVARELAARLRSRGVAADHYHGRRRAPERGRVQEAFAQGALRVVVATNAFGLGIDDPDIRFVVHRDPPGSIEAWWQEAGRAGRDGRPARCVLVHRPAGLSGAAALTRTARVRAEDLEALVAVLRRGPASAAGAARSAGMGRGRAARAVELMEQAGAVRRRGGRLHLEPGADPAAVPLALEERRELHERTRAAMLRTLAETGGCRREVLLPYLGDLGYRGPCGACDNDRGGRAAADPVAEAAAGALGDAAAPGARVVHPEFGEGVVQGMADGLLTVLFDDAGYRTIDPGLAAERGLLRPAGASDR